MPPMLITALSRLPKGLRPLFAPGVGFLPTSGYAIFGRHRILGTGLYMLTEKISRTRRRLLKITGLGLLVGTTCPALSHAAVQALKATGGYPHTPIADSMRAIGEAYLNRFPEERSRHTLLSAIQARSVSLGTPPNGPIPAALDRLVIEDFSTDDVVYLNGWALSRTEARIAALTVV